MEIYELSEDIPVTGFEVTTFPDGISEAFGSLKHQLPDGKFRAYYGISYTDNNGKIIYLAVAEQKSSEEAEKYHLTSYTIEKGEYLISSLKNWREKTSCIKDIFHDMMQDSRFDSAKPCVEWYKSDEEMLCMVKVNPLKKILHDFDNITGEMLALLRAYDEETLNTVPFPGSWTAGQLTEHIVMSNVSIMNRLNTAGQPATRDQDARVPEFKELFLDFDRKFKAAEAITPTKDHYEKELLLHELSDSIDHLKTAASHISPGEIILTPRLGETTKLEIVHFAVYHTTKHVHQLKNILSAIFQNKQIS